ncbi:MAG: hypothetical protein QXF13_05165, partial [Thermoproteota archaeon]
KNMSCEQYPPPPPPPPRRRWIIWIGLAIGCLITIGLMGFFLVPKEVEPSIYSQGQVTIRGTWGCDLDLGKETLVGDPSTDFKWNIETRVIRNLSPRNGAKFHVIGAVDFNSVKYSDLKKYSYSSDPINGNDDASNQMPQGTVIAAITSEGRYCKFRIDTYGYNIVISWVTYEKE